MQTTPPPTVLLIGSNNPAKAAEMREILQHNATVNLLMPSDIVGFPTDIAETGATLEENAYIKAAAIVGATHFLGYHAAIADDTGLEVDALHGQPGVYTARFAGENATYAENRTKLLTELHGVPLEQRTARFRTVVCYMDELRTFFAEGVCEGRIATEERGSSGFGYDAIFIPDGYDTTFAEMSQEDKHRISHRGRALTAFAERLQALG
jgi:XTP/dITP diphosphohydrolase